MGWALLWGVLGYFSCVWDCSGYSLSSRWPSATGAFVVLLAMHAPRASLWGAVLCGLVMDAAHGGPLGLRVLAGVIVASYVTLSPTDREEPHWTRVAIVTFAAVAVWLGTPLVAELSSGGSHWGAWELAQSIATSSLSTTLVTLAICRLTDRRGRED